MATYGESVFVNCPFDDVYRPIFEAIVFVVHDCGYVARSALEIADTGEVRIEKIGRLIRESRFGIHDISRIEADPRSKLPRFNMPLELGIFLGAKAFGAGRQRRKVALVLERKKFSYLKYCSDISGQDAVAHNGSPRAAAILVRDWLRTHSRFGMPDGNIMYRRFRRFRRDLPSMCAAAGLDHRRLIFSDYAALVSSWLHEQSTLGRQVRRGR